MKKSCSILFLFVLTITGCHYSPDKLKIKNASSESICYETLLQSNGEFYQVSGGGCAERNEINSPPALGAIWAKMENQSSDKTLYIVYYNVKDQEYVYKNVKKLISSKKFKVDKYTLKELDNLNWLVTYNAD